MMRTHTLNLAQSLYLVVLVVLIVPPCATAEDDTWDWIVSAEGNATTRCVATDSAGNVYVAGSFQTAISLGTQTLTSVNGTSDVFLFKLTPDGQAIWGRSAGGERLDRPWGVTWDPVGRVYLVGEFCSNSITFDTVILENNYQSPYIDDSSFDVFTVCYSDEGTILWARKAGGLWHDKATGIVHDGGGNVYILGTFLSSEITFDTLSLSNSGNIDLFLARYDADGHIQWARSAVGTGQDNAWSLAVDSEGMVYIAGSYRSPSLDFYGHILVNTSDDFDLYLAQYEQDGRTRWAVSASGQEWDDAEALATDQNDDVYLAGHFGSDTLSFDTTQLFLSNPEHSNNDMYLVKLDREGQLIWATSSTGPAWAYPSAACVVNTNELAVVGTFTGNNFGDTESFGPWPITTFGSYDIFLVNFDLAGNSLAAENYGGESMDFGQAVCRDFAGNLFLGAYFSSDSLSIGTVTLHNDYNNKMIVAKRPNSGVSPVPAIPPGEELATESFVLTNAPNPFNARTQIAYDLSQDGHVWLSIFDLRGRLICTLVDGVQTRGPHTVVWDGKDSSQNELASGVYFYRLKTGAGESLRNMTLIK